LNITVAPRYPGVNPQRFIMKKSFNAVLKVWMANSLSRYCLNECRRTCCQGQIRIDKGYEKLFNKFKVTGKEVPLRPENYKGPHLFKDKSNIQWYFKVGLCPNYHPATKYCLVHNKHPMCSVFPLEKVSDDKYYLSPFCELYGMLRNEKPLQDLILLCKKEHITLYGNGRRGPHSLELT